jgi:hypothetical protein
MPELLVDDYDSSKSKPIGDKRVKQKSANGEAKVRSSSLRRPFRRNDQAPSRRRSLSMGRRIKRSSCKDGPSRRRSLSTGPSTGSKSSSSRTSSTTSSSTKSSSARRVHKSLFVRSLSLHREGTDIKDELLKSCFPLLSPSMQLSSGSRLLSPSMRQGSSSCEISSSMRNFTPPFPEFADYNSRRSSRP